MHFLDERSIIISDTPEFIILNKVFPIDPVDPKIAIAASIFLGSSLSFAVIVSKLWTGCP